jgi:hypothetical protein
MTQDTRRSLIGLCRSWRMRRDVAARRPELFMAVNSMSASCAGVYSGMCSDNRSSRSAARSVCAEVGAARAPNAMRPSSWTHFI